MRIRLDYEDNPVFTTITAPLIGKYRTLIVKINGKPFSAWRTINEYEFFHNDERYIKQVDEMLIGVMERMFEKIFVDACGAIPEGKNLLDEDRDELSR